VAKGRYEADDFFASSSVNATLEAELEEARQQLECLSKENNQLVSRLNDSGVRSSKLEVAVDDIYRSADQTRTWFDPDKLQKLADAIERVGFKGTILLGPQGVDGKFPLIYGERRLRAVELLGWSHVPGEVVDVDPQTAKLLTFTENTLREDLNPYEETIGMIELISSQLELSFNEVVSTLYQMKNAYEGKAINPHNADAIQHLIVEYLPKLNWLSFVTSRLKLLKLPTDIQEALKAGQLEYTKAVAISRAPEEHHERLLSDAIKSSLSLSEINARIKLLNGATQSSANGAAKLVKPILRIKTEGLSQEDLITLQDALKQKLKAVNAALRTVE
jgi:ParB family chromosome partitioning protein